jgi:hypothetical protein
VQNSRIEQLLSSLEHLLVAEEAEVELQAAIARTTFMRPLTTTDKPFAVDTYIKAADAVRSTVLTVPDNTHERGA